MKNETDILDIERGIAELALKFLNQPEIFKREEDLHYEFHDILLKMKKNELRVRWEYPTLFEHYEFNESEKVLEIKKDDGTTGYFDLALVSDKPDKIPFAFEFKLDIDNYENDEKINFKKYLPHAVSDFEKLSNPFNSVQNGYILYFLRSYIPKRSSIPYLEVKIQTHNQRKDESWGKLQDLPQNNKIKIAFIECDIISEKKTHGIRDLPDKWLKKSDMFIEKK